MLSPAAVTWLNQFAALPLNDRQRLALVYLRQHEQLGNADYRRLNHVDALAAGAELRGLVQAGLVTQHGAGRWTYYKLAVPDGLADVPADEMTEEERILEFVCLNGAITNGQCQALLEVGKDRA